MLPRYVSNIAICFYFSSKPSLTFIKKRNSSSCNIPNSDETQLNYKNSINESLDKSAKNILSSLKEGVRLTVIGIDANRGVGVFKKNGNVLNKPLGKINMLKYGDSMVTRLDENGKRSFQLDSRSKYACGIVKMDPTESFGLLHHINNMKPFAAIPNVTSKSMFEENSLYTAFIHNEVPRNSQFLVASLHRQVTHVNNPLSQLISHAMYNGLGEHIFHDLSNESLLNNDFSWEPSESDLSGRRSFLDDFVFTVDPISSKDFDDALSYKELDENTVEVGIHIADVTHFLDQDQRIDQKARNLSATLYGCARVYHMLPTILSNEKCSLKPGQVRLAYSAVLTFNKSNGHLISSWFGKTVIKSKCRLNYEQAEYFICGKTNFIQNNLHLEDIRIYDNYIGIEHMEDTIKKLYSLGLKIIRNKRMKGRYTLTTNELKFDIDEQTNFPTGVKIKTALKSNDLIECFMCEANEAVGSFLRKMLPNCALLRNHTSKAENYVKEKICEALSLPSKLLSLPPPKLLKLIENDSTRYLPFSQSLNLQKFRHTGLAIPFYTHFTSPIRRYADVLVHRQLNHVLYNKRLNYEDTGPNSLMEICHHLNVMDVLISKTDTIDNKYNLSLYLGNNPDDERFKEVVSGVTTPERFLSDDRNYFAIIPSLGIGVSVESEKDPPNFLETTKVDVIPSEFPYWVKGKSIEL